MFRWSLVKKKKKRCFIGLGEPCVKKEGSVLLG